MKSENGLEERLEPQQDSINSTEPSVKDLRLKNQYLASQRLLNGRNIFQTIFFTWISPLLSYGSRFQVDEKSMPFLKTCHKPKIEFDQLMLNFGQNEKSSTEGLTLVKSVAQTFKKNILVLFLATFVLIIAMTYQPILMNQMMSYARDAQKTFSQSLIYFLGILISSFVVSVAFAHIFYNFAVFGFNLSNTLSLMLYDKALKHPLVTEKQYSTSDIINFSQVDAQRMTNMGFQLVSLFLVPIQIILGMLLLYYYIGISFLVGVGVMALLMILTLTFTKISTTANDKLLKAKDARMKVTEEILEIIKYIKVNAHEKYFFQKLNRKREEELRLNKTVNLMNIWTIVIFWLSSPLIVSFTFLVYLNLGNQITAPKAFTTIILFQSLQYPMRMLPTALAEVIQMWSSIKRIQKFLLSREINPSYITFNDDQNQPNAVEIKHGTFLWGAEKKKEEDKDEKSEQKQKKKSKQQMEIMSEEIDHKQSLISRNQEDDQEKAPQYIRALDNINVQIPSNSVTMIVGDIGSGKSSLLYAILCEMSPDPQCNPEITINGSLAYCTQKPWIRSGTVKQNITFFQPYDEMKMKKVIYYSALQDDLKILSKGIETEIGEKGVNLSGGQKARISLARALYSDKDILLLDDVLSAVDVHVGKFLMEKTILGFLRKKTVIMPTHAISFADQCDNIIVMKKGKITKEGTFDSIFESEEFQEIYNIEKRKRTEEEKEKKGDDEEKILSELKVLKEATSIDKKEEGEANIKSNTDKLVEQLIMPEDHKKGEVGLKIYKDYVNYMGGVPFVLAIIVLMTAWTVFSARSNIEIEHWCQSPSDSFYHVYIYMGLAISASLFLGFRAYLLVMSGIKQGRLIHKKMAKSLLYASLTKFYNRVPVGRILNRLSKDLREIDESVGYAFSYVLVAFFSLCGNLFICIYASTPYVIIPIVFVAFVCYKLQRYYLKTQRETTRLEKVTTSPIVSGFTSAINGVGTIRAYEMEHEFLAEQIDKVELNKRMRISKEALEAWFSMRLSMFTFFINMTAIGYAILSDSKNASVIGLLLTYAMNLNGDIVDTIFSFANLETVMISVERAMSFIKIEPQSGYKQYCEKWRTKEEGYNKQLFLSGNIRFQMMGAKYRKDLPLVLKNINLEIKQGEKVGVVGRTGAGKSTLLSCLLRILEPSEGAILIDEKNILEYPLKDLRYNITMIDQEPTLIQGSFRENLDPAHFYSISELESIIEECHLDEIVKEKGGLETEITNESLSVGEKQLLCICRAFLKKSKIVLIDEATANIDTKNDKMIQEVIATKFKYSTVLTIAHRLSTLKNSDKILVLGEGKVLEWGSPNQLLANREGIYRRMCDSNDSSYLE